MTLDGPFLLGLAAVIGATVAPLNLILTFVVNRRQATLAHEMNSVRDALVASTAKASHAEGMAEQRELTNRRV